MNVYTVACHILNLKIDEQLNNYEKDIVTQIANVLWIFDKEKDGKLADFLHKNYAKNF